MFLKYLKLYNIFFGHAKIIKHKQISNEHSSYLENAICTRHIFEIRNQTFCINQDLNNNIRSVDTK